MQLGLVQRYTYPDYPDIFCTTSHQIGWWHPLVGVSGDSLMVGSRLINVEPINLYPVLSSASYQSNSQHVHLWSQQESREPTIALKVYIYPLIILGRAQSARPLLKLIFLINQGSIGSWTHVLIVKVLISYTLSVWVYAKVTHKFT